MLTGERGTALRQRPGAIVRLFLVAAILTIGLTEYRARFGGLGDLSDLFFFGAFALSAVGWVVALDGDQLRRLGHHIRELEGMLFGGGLILAGAVVASFISDTPSISWIVTFKYASTFCIWLPWVSVVAGAWLTLRRAHLIYTGALTLVAAATLSDIFLKTRFGFWLVSNPPNVQLNALLGLRYGGPAGHPTTLGYITGIGFLLSLSYVVGAGKAGERLLGLAGVALCGGALLVSGSRAALLGIAVGCLTMAVVGSRTTWWRIAAVLVGGISILWIGSRLPSLRAITPVDPLARLEESIQPRRDFEADWERRRDLERAIYLLEDDPVTGYGMDNVGTSPTQSVGFNLHNTVLQSWLAGGMLLVAGTLVLYATVLLAGWRATRLGHPLAPSLLAACVAFVAMDMFHPHLYMRFKWFAAALLLATLREATRSAMPDVPATPALRS